MTNSSSSKRYTVTGCGNLGCQIQPGTGPSNTCECSKQKLIRALREERRYSSTIRRVLNELVLSIPSKHEVAGDLFRYWRKLNDSRRD